MTDTSDNNLPLLGPDDPAPVRIVNPNGTAPVLIVCDHASNAVPAALHGLGLAERDLHRHIAYDIGAAAVTRSLADRLDAIAVLSGYSRLLIDCNRAPGHPQSVPEVSDSVVVPGNHGRSEQDLETRAEVFFWPYRRAIDSALAHLWRVGPPPALFSIHSFTPTLKGVDRFWDIGVLWNRDPRIALPLIDQLRRHDHLHVGDNEPYSGRRLAYSINLHGGTAGLPNCAVEIRQDHVESVEETEGWADMLADALSQIMTDETLHRVQHF